MMPSRLVLVKGLRRRLRRYPARHPPRIGAGREKVPLRRTPTVGGRGGPPAGKLLDVRCAGNWGDSRCVSVPGRSQGA